MDQTHQAEGDEQPDSRWKWSLAGFLAVAAFFLWTEHRAHLLGILPYLLVLACPLMHIFHHAGHGRGAHRQGPTAHQDDRKREAPPSGEQS
jgi:hypothetical protein